MASEKPRSRTPAPMERTIDDLESLRTISDPLRLKILELTSSDPTRAWSAKEIAAALRTSQTKLYHHLALMEEHRFLRVAETRMVSGIQERRYAATAHTFHVDRRLLSGSEGEAALSSSIGALFDKARAEIMAGVHAGFIDISDDRPDAKQGVAIWASQARLSKASVRKVMRQIERLQRLDATDDADGTPYGMLVAFYPRPDADPDGDTNR